MMVFENFNDFLENLYSDELNEIIYSFGKNLTLEDYFNKSYNTYSESIKKNLYKDFKPVFKFLDEKNPSKIIQIDYQRSKLNNDITYFDFFKKRNNGQFSIIESPFSHFIRGHLHINGKSYKAIILKDSVGDNIKKLFVNSGVLSILRDIDLKTIQKPNMKKNFLFR